MSTIFIIAGPNGAGKTTYARQFLPTVGAPEFINADDIARDIAPDAPDSIPVKASRHALERMDDLAQSGTPFAFETTLAGKNYQRRIPKWRTQGYSVYLTFLSLPSVELALERVRVRVQQGGHNIPEPVIRRRFEAGFRNFSELYQPLVTAWELYDNSGEEPLLKDAGPSIIRS